jgi:diadenosine tetraphosphatase ApaH/serine/threonine PP2A family protein phosphatase
VLYDEARADVTFHRLAYDYQATAHKIRAAGLNAFYAERLARGR